VSAKIEEPLSGFSVDLATAKPIPSQDTAEDNMSDHETFYAAVLSAGAILTGFSGTFMQFRIQREANYYRQPVLSYVERGETGKAQDTYIGLTHFTASFLLIITATLVALTFGFVVPLLALAEIGPWPVTPRFVALGLLSALFPFVGLLSDGAAPLSNSKRGARE
jgi:hypothetical protein